MKILVTGGSGLIGSHLVESLVADGENVRCFVRTTSNLSFISNLDIDIVYGDLKDFESLRKATEGIDIVYHLAAISRLHLNMPLQEYQAVNVEGTRNVLEASRIAGVKKIIYTSSIEAVGPTQDGGPFNEETEPNPTNNYGETKLGGERVARKYYKDYGMNVIIVRPPMIYGPRNLLLVKRLFRIINKGYYPIVGDGKALMEFCYVKNEVYGIRLAGERGKAGETYFISDERSYSTEEVVREIAKQLGVNLKIFHIPVPVAWGIGFSFEVLSKFFKFYPFMVRETGRPSFSRNTVKWTSKSTWFCDISKAKRELGYRPPYTLSEGIRETIEWYRGIGVL
jgi:UDP-glucose 4-epimerase